MSNFAFWIASAIVAAAATLGRASGLWVSEFDPQLPMLTMLFCIAMAQNTDRYKK